MTEESSTTQTTESTRVRTPVDDEISLWEVLAVLLRRRRTIVLTTIAISVLAVAVTLLPADKYTTT
ncbi:MAG: hypothetical protein IIC35_08820, partial [Gemmatimonadetes bacterium]|nr:hypothetical protein [Gemmatimonadota bacterium]